MEGPESFGPLIYNLPEAIAFYRQVFEVDGQIPPEVQRCIETLEKHFKEMPADAPPIEQGTTPYLGSVTVNNIDEAIQRVREAGGSIAVEKGELESLVGGWQCFVCDKFGNMFSLYQPGPE